MSLFPQVVGLRNFHRFTFFGDSKVTDCFDVMQWCRPKWCQKNVRNRSTVCWLMSLDLLLGSLRLVMSQEVGSKLEPWLLSQLAYRISGKQATAVHFFYISDRCPGARCLYCSLGRSALSANAGCDGFGKRIKRIDMHTSVHTYMHRNRMWNWVSQLGQDVFVSFYIVPFRQPLDLEIYCNALFGDWSAKSLAAVATGTMG